ncbi:NACHT domain-containing protein [Streptomyces sp. NPDC005507]|uniref:NACHT domain-containing protein n=1 Tax=Streptomyces sp. NPDC005507 TaxID=3154885 RepID=UPI0033A08F60
MRDAWQRVRYSSGLLLASACLAVGIWAAITLIRGNLTTSDKLGVFGLLIALLPVAGVAAKVLKPPAVDIVQASRELAEAVEAGELAQRTQLLGGGIQPIDVAFTFRAAPSRVAAGAVSTSRLSEISDYYRRLRPRRLLITGVAGAGKTVLAVELMLGLLEQREDDEPVPVRMALAGWDTTQPLDEWMADKLTDTYQLSNTTARRLIDRRCVLPVLDGLDEMDAEVGDAGSSRAAAALAALNRYQVGRQRGPLVVTCRTTTYDALATGRIPLLDAARVEMSSVTAEQAQRFIEARVFAPEDWHPVIDHARRHPHGAAAHVLSVPWLLTLAVTVHEVEGNPAELLRFPHTEALRSHLLDRFVPAAIELHKQAGNPVYRTEQVRSWLGFLARYLSGNVRERRTMGGHVLSGTDLVLHRLWPIAGMRARVVDIAISSIAALVSVFALAPISMDPAAMPSNIVLALLAIGWIYVSARSVWPVPKSISPGRLRTSEGRRAIVGPITVALIAMLAVSLATVLPYVGAGYVPAPAYDLVVNLTLLSPIALIGGFAFGLRRNLETTASSKGPNALIRVDLHFGLLIGISVGAALALSIIVWSITDPDLVSFGGTLTALIFLVVLIGSIVGVIVGIMWASASRRYFATLLCTRGRLPWRLGRFLAWASDAGLLRIAGNAYQFRHRELQDHLADAEAPR